MIYFKRKSLWKRLARKLSEVELPRAMGFFSFLKAGVIFLALFIIFIYSSYLFLLPKYVTDEKVEYYLNNYLKAHSKLVLDIKNLKVSPDYKFDIKINADKISLDFPNKTNFITLDKPDIEIDLLTLFFKYIDLNKIKADRIVINTNFTKNNHYDCFDYFDKYIFEFKDSKFTLRNIKIVCNELIFNLFDENIKKNFKLHTKKLTFSSSDVDKPINIQTQGVISGTDKIVDFKLNLQFTKQKDILNKFNEKLAMLNYNPLIHASKFKFYTNSDIDLKIHPNDSKFNVSGKISLSDLSFVIDNIQIPKNNLLLIFSGQKIKAQGDFNLIKDQFIKLDLTADYSKNKFIEMKLNSSEIDLFDLDRIANSLIKIFNLKYNFDSMIVEGKTSADLYLKSNFKTITSRGFASVKNAKLTDKKTGLALHDVNSNISFDNNKINIQNATALVGDSKFHMEGSIDNQTNVNLKINSDTINIAQIINTLKSLPLLSRLVPELKDYIFKSGFVKVNATVNGTINDPVIKTQSKVSDFKVFLKPYNCLVQSNEILISADPEGNEIKNIFITAKNNIINYNNNIISNPISKLKISGSDIVIDKTQVIYDKIKADVQGVIKNYSLLELNLKAPIPLDNNLIIIKNKVPKLVADVAIDKNRLSLKDAKIVDGAKNIALISGNIFDYSSDNPRFENLRVSLTDKISCILPKFDLNFEASGDASVSGTLRNPIISGSMKLYNVICEKYNLFIKDCDVLVKNSNLQGTITTLDIMDTTLNSVLFEGNLQGDILKIKNFSADVFMGKISGNAQTNIKSFHTTSELVLKEISVRYLTSYLKQSSIAVSGKLSALMRLEFTGLDYESAINSLKGYIKFNIDNGELAQFAKLERFLQAGNILSQSILKLTLNSIVSSVTKQNTGDFKTIEGTIKINSPTADIQYINTQGTNMSMHIEGKYNIINNHAILKVLGKIPLNIVNVMGNIGKFSLSKLFDKEDVEASAIEKMMSVYMSEEDKNKIPSLAGYQATNQTREFVVIIDGLLNNNNAIKYFKWAQR